MRKIYKIIVLFLTLTPAPTFAQVSSDMSTNTDATRRNRAVTSDDDTYSTNTTASSASTTGRSRLDPDEFNVDQYPQEQRPHRHQKNANIKVNNVAPTVPENMPDTSDR